MSIQDAIYIIRWNLIDRGGSDGFSSMEFAALNKAVEALQAMEERDQRAEWHSLECSNCGHSLFEFIDEDSSLSSKVERFATPFCPFCGKPMEPIDMYPEWE